MIDTTVVKPDNKKVRDYKGNLVPKSKTLKIMGNYYVKEESCFLMEDGQWYRITSTEKISYDHYLQKHVLKSNSSLISGIINAKGESGLFSQNDFTVTIRDTKKCLEKTCLNEDIAREMGYIECVGDGLFYCKDNITSEDRKGWFDKKNIPSSERSKDYNLESAPEKKAELQKNYEDLKLKISGDSKRISRLLGDFSIGCEAEVINGFLPRRVRSKYGIKTLKDGSLRHDNGEGQEFVTVPIGGAKGIELLRRFFKELTARCEVNELCSLHFHFGKVRKDKLYVLSLYRLCTLLQPEVIKYFPYSRSNSIKPDGKVYCKLLEDLNIKYERIFNAKEEDDFHKVVVDEFGKIYKWMNHGKELAEAYGPKNMQTQVLEVDGKKMFRTVWLKNVYTTKSNYHAIQGNKWDRNERYYWVNFLNLFFSKMETVEFRIHEGTTNFTKAIVWLLTCSSILRYAENLKECLTSSSIDLEDVLKENLGKTYSDYIMAYYKHRKSEFCPGSTWSSNWKTIEKRWFKDDPEFEFKKDNIEIK